MISDKEYGSLPSHHEVTKDEMMVIGASSLGTIFEWYDFYLYGLLASQITKHFFSNVDPSTGFIFALAAFAAGFAVRPFGALVFGRLGDIVGRKYTFLVTMLIMGAATFGVGILPGFDQWGIISPSILIGMRLLQGLAMGGEYGGAATYVAEHAPNHKRGLYTSWIQTTASVGLFAALLIVIAVKGGMSKEAFDDWGWRIPFVSSILLLGVSMVIRLRMNESPVYKKMKEEGTGSKAPIKDAFGKWSNLKYVFICLFGAVAGQAVVWYAGQFYAMFFIEKMLKVDSLTTNILVTVALSLAVPFFVVFGWLSDKIGRKPIIMAGLALFALTAFPAFKALTKAGNPAFAAATENSPVTVSVDPSECSVMFDPVGKQKFDSKSCDIAKNFLAKQGISYKQENAAPGTIASIKVGDKVVASPDPKAVTGDKKKAAIEAFQKDAKGVLKAAGYPEKADPATINKPLVVIIVAYLVILATMVYGPIAAMLVELFPTAIRYTSMSLPYHLGNGWFGGFLPTIAFAMVAAKGDIFHGLWYPVGVALATLVIGMIFLPETYKNSIDN